MGKCQKVMRIVFALTTLSLTISFCLFPSPPSHPHQFAVLTLAVPSSQMPLPLQLVLAYGWQLQTAKEGMGYPWWTLGGFGITFVTENKEVDDLRSLLLRVWRQTDWDPLTARQARFLASQQISAWRHEPMEWLRWQARVIAMGDHLTSLDPKQPSRIRLEDISKVLRKLSRYDLPLLQYDLTPQPLPFTAVTASSPSIHQKFQQTLRLPTSQRTHGFWWMLTKGDPAVAMVVGELLGGGTGAKWYQLLRVEKPIAYHAVAQVQWTPVGSELTLYAATTTENFKLVRQRAQQLLINLRQGKISGSEFERARKLAQLRFSQMTSDPVNLSRAKAIWLMLGRSLEEWENLPVRLQSLSLEEALIFCRSLPSASEIFALP